MKMQKKNLDNILSLQKPEATFIDIGVSTAKRDPKQVNETKRNALKK